LEEQQGEGGGEWDGRKLGKLLAGLKKDGIGQPEAFGFQGGGAVGTVGGRGSRSRSRWVGKAVFGNILKRWRSFLERKHDGGKRVGRPFGPS